MRPELNHIYITARMSKIFDDIKDRMHRNYVYKQNGILQEGTVTRWAKNYSRDGKGFCLMFVTTSKANPKTVEDYLDEIAKDVDPKPYKLGARPQDTSHTFGG